MGNSKKALEDIAWFPSVDIESNDPSMQGHRPLKLRLRRNCVNSPPTKSRPQGLSHICGHHGLGKGVWRRANC